MTEGRFDRVALLAVLCHDFLKVLKRWIIQDDVSLVCLSIFSVSCLNSVLALVL